MTEEELTRLLDVVRERPVRSAKFFVQRKGRFVTHEDRVRLGEERALMYKTMVLTGLRKKELTRLEWEDLDLNGRQGYLTLKASDTKSGKRATIPLRSDLAEDLRGWREVRGNPAGGEAVFDVPRNLVRVLKKDLKEAGIPYQDDKGYYADVHALRHTPGTLLSSAGVPPEPLGDYAARRYSHHDADVHSSTA